MTTFVPAPAVRSWETSPRQCLGWIREREKEKEGERERIESLHWRFCGDHFDPGVAVRRGTLNPELAVEVRRGVGLGGIKTFMLRCVSLALP